MTRAPRPVAVPEASSTGLEQTPPPPIALALDPFLARAPVGMGFLDRELRFFSVNAALAATSGRGVEDHLGCTMAEVMPAFWPELEPICRRVLDGETVIGAQLSAELNTDETHHWIAHFYPLGADGTQPQGIGIVVQDDTERRRTEIVERALRDSQQRLDLALNAAEIGLFEWNLATGIGVWSRHHYLIFGYAPGQGAVTSAEFESRLWPEDLTRFHAEMADALANRRTFETEYRIRRPTGESRTITSSAHFDFDPQGMARRMTGVVIDITERRAATAELARRERQFASLMAHSPDVFARFDHELRYTYASPAIERFLGLPPVDVLGRTNADLGVEPFVRARWDSALQRVFERGRSDRFAFEWARDGLGMRQQEARLIPERADTGEVESVLAIVSDVTDRHSAEQALREADKRKDEFLATLAHELRNPLAPLRNGLELLSQPADAPTTARVGAMMQRQLQQLVHLVDDLLDVGRITRGRLTLRLEPVLLSAVLDNVLEVSRPMIEAAGHELVLDVPRRPLHLEVDATRLAQVVTNLLNNAARYTPGGGRIELGFRAEGRELTITVRDNGVGIPRAMLDRVFDLFTQAEPGMGRAQGGLGIGLTLVKRLVEMHGGRVEAQSAGPGQGSCFVAVMPVVMPAVMPEEDSAPAQPAAPAAVTASAERASTSPPLSVLVVDDNRDSAETLGLVLELSGHRVALAHDGAHALALAAGSAPEVAVLDIGLPDMTGHDLARRLRAMPGGEHMLLVAVTGWGQTQDRNRSVAAGFDHHLVKPVDPAQLEALLATHRASG